MKYLQLLKTTEKFAEKLVDRFRANPSTKLKTVEDLLREHNITPIQSKKTRDSYVGEGEYSFVHRVFYKGKQAVAKITVSSADANKMINLQKFGNSLGFLKKHVPNVFDVIKTKDTDNHDIFIIVVEELIPLNQTIKSLFKGEKPLENLSIFNSKNILKTVITNLLIKRRYDEKFKENFESIVNHLVNFLPNYIQPLTESLKEREFSEKQAEKFAIKISQGLIDELINFITRKISNSNQTYNFIEMTKGAIELQFENFLVSVMMKNHKFPISTRDYQDQAVNQGLSTFEHLPESRSLMTFLKLLNKKFDVRWADLQTQNLMQRPEAGDIVISDPGLFINL